MTEGILATVAVRNPSSCPVATMSRGEAVKSVSQGKVRDEQVSVEVTTAGAVPGDHQIGEQVFEYESEAVYRLEREAGVGCACERIEDHGCPVREMSAAEGQLLVTFIADDVETLRTVIEDLREREPSVSVRCLKRSSTDQSERETMFIDRESFTERQREVLRTAHEMGYFDHPKRANATEVAAELDISTSTFAEHLAAAQSKLMDALFPENEDR